MPSKESTFLPIATPSKSPSNSNNENTPKILSFEDRADRLRSIFARLKRNEPAAALTILASTPVVVPSTPKLIQISPKVTPKLSASNTKKKSPALPPLTSIENDVKIAPNVTVPKLTLVEPESPNVRIRLMKFSRDLTDLPEFKPYGPILRGFTKDPSIIPPLYEEEGPKVSLKRTSRTNTTSSSALVSTPIPAATVPLKAAALPVAQGGVLKPVVASRPIEFQQPKQSLTPSTAVIVGHSIHSQVATPAKPIKGPIEVRTNEKKEPTVALNSFQVSPQSIPTSSSSTSTSKNEARLLGFRTNVEIIPSVPKNEPRLMNFHANVDVIPTYTPHQQDDAVSSEIALLRRVVELKSARWQELKALIGSSDENALRVVHLKQDAVRKLQELIGEVPHPSGGVSGPLETIVRLKRAAVRQLLDLLEQQIPSPCLRLFNIDPNEIPSLESSELRRRVELKSKAVVELKSLLVEVQ